MELSSLLAAAAEIRDAQQAGENTADRVGTLLVNIITELCRTLPAAGITLKADAAGTGITVSYYTDEGTPVKRNVILPVATTTIPGLLSTTDKAKLDAANGALATQAYANKAATNATNDSLTKSGFTLVHDLAGNYYNKNITATETSAAFELETGNGTTAKMTIPAATSTSAGLMSAADKQAIADAPDAGKEAALVEIYRQAFCRGRVFQATYNAHTKLWTMHGITDITTAQMGVIYRALQNSPQVSFSDFSYEFPAATDARTLPALTRPQQGYIGASYNVVCVAAYGDAKAATILRPFVNNYNHITNAKQMFRNCTVLRVILDAAGGTTGYDGTTPNGLDLSPIEANSGTQDMFDVASSTGVVAIGCPALEEVRIRGLRVSLLIASPVLSYDSLKYLADNAGTAITGATLTLHPDVYAKFTQGDREHTPADWQLIESTLNDKGFSIAEAIINE